ncbi:MAG: hypothetical protein VR78_13350 [Hoeflea sp. BRH_c9]|nr:MAG: hypothetical protein VR78_13350 [Hoeflea sp. BRH_c9]
MADHQQLTRGSGGGSRGNKVYRALTDRIRSRELQPGARVREEDIALSLGVSRTPVREAFARLQERGLLETSSAGLTVAQLNRPQVMELYAMRAKLEGAAAAFAAENASPSDVVSIRHAATFFSAQGGAPGHVARANTLFHEAIYEAAHNRYLMRMLEDLNDSLALLPDTTFSVPGRADAARAEHQAIFEAIENRDPLRAEQAAGMHIRYALEGRLMLLYSVETQ